MAEAFNPLQLHADVNWQIAKGYLQAVLAVQGAKYPVMDEGQPSKYERLKVEIAGFVSVVEDDELHL